MQLRADTACPPQHQLTCLFSSAWTSLPHSPASVISGCGTSSSVGASTAACCACSKPASSGPSRSLTWEVNVAPC
eukprot:3449398-Pyramimonas_sp.AAC.1